MSVTQHNQIHLRIHLYTRPFHLTSFRFTIITDFKPLRQRMDFQERWARATLMQKGHKLRTCVIQKEDAKQLKPELHYILLQKVPYKIQPFQIPILFHDIAMPNHFIIKNYPRAKNPRPKYAYIGFPTVDPVIQILLHHKSHTSFDTQPVLARFVMLPVIKH